MQSSLSRSLPNSMPGYALSPGSYKLVAHARSTRGTRKSETDESEIFRRFPTSQLAQISPRSSSSLLRTCNTPRNAFQTSPPLQTATPRRRNPVSQNSKPRKNHHKNRKKTTKTHWTKTPEKAEKGRKKSRKPRKNRKIEMETQVKPRENLRTEAGGAESHTPEWQWGRATESARRRRGERWVSRSYRWGNARG